jgi:hypothetical protein
MRRSAVTRCAIVAGRVSVTVEQLAANRELPMLEDPRRTGGHD